MTFQLKYYVPFKAAEGVNADLALKEGILPIEGTAIDTSVNANKWQVPPEDLDFFTASLKGAQLRIDHAESVLSIVGKVPEAIRSGNQVFFQAEVGDPSIIPKILRGYVNHVSVQVDSDDTECSVCGKQTRIEGILTHLCAGAWEIVHKPRVRELSIVASPAYKNTAFHPVGFAAAMALSQLSRGNKDVGSKGDLQEPENKPESKDDKVKQMSQPNLEANASSVQAQTQPSSLTAGKKAGDLTYQELMDQMQSLNNQIETASDAEIEGIKTKISEIDAEVGKRATKKALTQKLNELSRKLSESTEDTEDACNKPAASKHAPKGQGIIATQEPVQGANLGWFQDLLKANSKLKGMQ
jgi:regulator of replication initiation timing